jgi:hypothetical protein
MIICVDLSREVKELMDSFLARGEYRDYAELLESALMNLNVLRSHLAKEKSLVIDIPAAGESTRRRLTRMVPSSSTGQFRTPELFKVRGGDTLPVLAPSPPKVEDAPQRYRPQQWLFGQYNKLLPVKATCRAIRSLLETSPEGVELTTAIAYITDAAVRLRQMLAGMDADRGSGKGEMLAAGFPTAEEKARLRFANQFVGSPTRAGGAVSGFPSELKLIGVVVNGKKTLTISLTQAGWDFTVLENPILDRSEPAGRLSEEESSFLLRHINTEVPAERAAYLTVLRAITNGSDTPDDLDKALREIVGDTSEITDSHLATQRAGAVARMFDLGLIGREKSGLFVRYFVKDMGTEFLESMSE